MHELHLQLQLPVLLGHAYFTVPLCHQVSTVSLFHVIFLAHVVDSHVLYLFWTACAFSCNLCTYSAQLSGRRNQTVALTHELKF